MGGSKFLIILESWSNESVADGLSRIVVSVNVECSGNVIIAMFTLGNSNTFENHTFFPNLYFFGYKVSHKLLWIRTFRI